MNKIKFIILAAGLMILAACSSNESDKNSEGDKNESTAKTEQNSPINQLFSSMETLKVNLTGNVFASANNDCLIDFRRDNRYKIFVKEHPGSDFIQFNGEKYRVTFTGDNQLCIEFDHLENPDGNASGVFTPSEFKLTFKHGDSFTYKNFRIVTSDEAKRLFE